MIGRLLYYLDVRLPMSWPLKVIYSWACLLLLSAVPGATTDEYEAAICVKRADPSSKREKDLHDVTKCH